MIRTVIKSQNNVVMVFDARGEQVLEYQGYYEDVREDILRAAPTNARFLYWAGCDAEPRDVAREDW